jgi:predicted nucleic acid-binding protein
MALARYMLDTNTVSYILKGQSARGRKNLMFKKVLLVFALALSFVSAMSVSASAPPPQCDPCPWIN